MSDFEHSHLKRRPTTRLHRVAIGYESFGPYHLARLSHLAEHVNLLALEFSRQSATYDWQPAVAAGFERLTLTEKAGDSSFAAIRLKIERALHSFRPDIVFVPGWAAAEALVMILWCRSNQVPAIVMSDSQEIDATRRKIKEFLKSVVLHQFSGAFVAGTPHVAYLEKLGFKKRPIAVHYDVIDNQHFEPTPETPPPSGRSSFLCCARLVEKKNLFVLLKAYRLYLDRLGDDTALPLVVLGEGPLRADLERELTALRLRDKIQLPGFVDYAALPGFYHEARCFILPSYVEQWGLVVNEAMAAGCPVLVSQRAGCVQDLVRGQGTGTSFNPVDPEQLACRMLDMHMSPDACDNMGQRARIRIGKLGLQAHAESVLSLCDEVRERPHPAKIRWHSSVMHLLLKLSLKGHSA